MLSYRTTDTHHSSTNRQTHKTEKDKERKRVEKSAMRSTCNPKYRTVFEQNELQSNRIKEIIFVSIYFFFTHFENTTESVCFLYARRKITSIYIYKGLISFMLRLHFSRHEYLFSSHIATHIESTTVLKYILHKTENYISLYIFNWLYVSYAFSEANVFVFLVKE